MRTKYGRVLLMAVTFVLLAAAAATAADQNVQADVVPADELSISVEDQVFLQAEVGQASGQYAFGMQIVNTQDTAWEVSVTSENLWGYEQVCDENGACTDNNPTGETIPASALHVWGGDQDNWEDETAIVASDGVLDTTTPLVIMEGTTVAAGSFGVDNPRPSIELTVPGSATAGQYQAIVTYTIAPVTP